MAGGCCSDGCAPAPEEGRFRRVLWIALAINGAMFAVEFVVGFVAGSASLQADAVDFFADAANYAVSLSVAGLALGWRARASLLKGATMGLFGIGILAAAGWRLLAGTVPEAELMGWMGLAALAANLAVAAMLFRFREGESNQRSVWLCSRNDVIGNLAVLAAASGVFATGTAYPDLLVAAILAGLQLSAAWAIVRQARGELRLAAAAA
jgi:Co/Zn/Cd efflux system component